MKDGIIPVTLRMPAELHNWIKQQASADRRSNHSFILMLIEKARDANHAQAT